MFIKTKGVLDFLVAVLFREEGIMLFFPGNLSTGTDLVINFELVKCITKININSYPNYNGKVEAGLSPER